MTQLRLHPNHLPVLKNIAYAMRDQAKYESENRPPYLFGEKKSPREIKKAEALSLTAKGLGFKDWGELQHALKQAADSQYHPQFIPSSGGYMNALDEEFGISDFFFTHRLLEDYIYEDVVTKAYEKQLAAMVDNDNASESTDAFYSYPAEEGKRLDLVILSGGTGYGVVLDSTGTQLENEVTVIAPRFVGEGRVLDLTDYDDPATLGGKANDLLSQIENMPNDQPEADVFGGMKIYSEMEGPFFHTCPLFLLNKLPEKEDPFGGPSQWREDVRAFHKMGGVSQLYYLPTPINIEGDSVYFVEKAESHDDLMLFSDCLYVLPEGCTLPSDAVVLDDVDRIYLSMAVREWGEDEVAQKWAQGSLRADVAKCRSNQQICDALGI